jgi:hypothetical protein
MWRYFAGGVAALLMVAAGWLLLGGRAASEAPALAAAPRAPAGQADAAGPLPDSVPEATPMSREQRRFRRYDKDRDGSITREEYLASRRKAYARLDANRDGQLSFDEWSAKTVAKFAAADSDRSGAMSAAEFATTAVKRRPRVARADCPKPAPAAAASGDDEG